MRSIAKRGEFPGATVREQTVSIRARRVVKHREVAGAGNQVKALETNLGLASALNIDEGLRLHRLLKLGSALGVHPNRVELTAVRLTASEAVKDDLLNRLGAALDATTGQANRVNRTVNAKERSGRGRRNRNPGEHAAHAVGVARTSKEIALTSEQVTDDRSNSAALKGKRDGSSVDVDCRDQERTSVDNAARALGLKDHADLKLNAIATVAKSHNREGCN